MTAPVAIVSAMHDELRALLPVLEHATTVRLAGRDFHHGRIAGHAVILALSGVGKVAAATTAVVLMQAFQVRQLVFTGVAGGLGAGVKVGDVVVARQLLHHDMDATPLFPRFEVPLTGRTHFDADAGLAQALADAARRCLDGVHALIGAQHCRDFGLEHAAVHHGMIISGDQFISSHAQSAQLRRLLPQALAVEMEGAAVAQACADFDRPFAVLRTVSDRADDQAHVDFTRFIAEVASAYTRAIVHDWLAHTPV